MVVDKKPWDDARGRVSKELDEASKHVHDAHSRPVQHVIDVLQSEVDRIKELTGSARHALDETAQQAWAATATAVAPVVDVYKRADGKEGTELRKSVAVAREALNVKLYAARQQLQETKQIANDQLVPVKSALAGAQELLLKANAFQREHPAMAAAGVVAVVGFPSLLTRGKWCAVRNSTVVASAGAAVSYGLYKWEEKNHK
ncbi:unnamed protein product [Hyaloperonospora brassicae]|uniref:MICOS complex subunit n=1 Tax=Hyaloperonospora brassicae TaxID=162125 RepID=A0AAV0TX90_HYABA|nr:unnamed protein product [Hyaloperonospora brassicae]